MKHFACLSAGVTYVANGEPPIGIPWETFQNVFAILTTSIMKKGVIYMFNLGEKIALSITAVESILFVAGIKYAKKVYDDTYLDKYGMTVSEYVKTVMESKDMNDYEKRLNKEES